MKKFLLLFLISVILAENGPPGYDKQMITKDKWVDDIITLAKDRKSDYNNKHPYNVLYYDGKKWTADCLNLHKALFNGRDINNFKVGDYQHNLKNTGDITVDQMINRCTDVQKDFRKLKEGEPRILHMKRHIGAYLGKIIKVNGNEYNVVEATASFGHKIALSWVDSDGTRRAHRGGSKNGVWLLHGKPTRWVKY